MKLIVGLGNPGKKYEHTRHNFGFMVVDKLAAENGASWTAFNPNSSTCKFTAQGVEVMLLKPQTFMNESGTGIQEVLGFYKVVPEDLWLVHDDLDLPFGTVRESFDSSSAGHRGVESTIETLGTKQFHRLRLGLGRPPQDVPAEAFVLQPFTTTEQEALSGVVARATEVLLGALVTNNKNAP
jgi:PTH1 family peptidyl-tRNA hydrolase